jgi:uncharacterized membrane protein SpoIIM required for sporulation
MAGAAGFKIPYEIIRYLAGKKETILTKEDVKDKDGGIVETEIKEKKRLVRCFIGC